MNSLRLLPTILLAGVWCGNSFGQSYTISTFAGGGAPVNVAGTSASLGSPDAVTVDGQGNLYFANQNTILRLDAITSIVTLVAGNGTPGFSGDNGPATAAQIDYPFGVAVDSAGNVYIADSHNNRIRKVSNGVITTVAGNGLAYFSGDNGPATTAALSFPWGVAVDSAGNLYIADTYNQRIREVTNGVITTVAGTGTAGFSGDNGPATAAQLSGPIAIAADSSGNLYVAAAGNERIRKISGGIITTVAGNGTQGFSGDNGLAVGSELNNPQGIAVDSLGNLYIADTQNFEIRKVSGGIITTIAGNRTQGFSGDGGPAASAQLSGPYSVTVDLAGNLYMADYNRIRRVSAGIITTVAGNGLQPGFSGDGGPATAAQMNAPSGVALDKSGDLFISTNDRVREVSAGVITTVAGIGTAGFSGDNGPAVSAELYLPDGVALNSAGSLYIADLENNRVRMVSNGVITTVAGTGFAGIYASQVGDGGPAVDAYLSGPSGVVVDSAGNLYIADSAHSRVREVASGVITTVAGNGTAGFSGDNGPATVAQLGAPAAIAVDSSGNLYITDGGRIRMVSKGIITTVAGNGTQGFAGDNGPAVGASLNGPVGVAVDSAGNLYIADAGNNRVRMVTNGVIATIAGNGFIGFSGDGGPATGAELSVAGVAADSAGNVYVSDPGNSRIRLLTPGSSSVPPQQPVIQAVVNAVDYSTLVAPGSWVAIFGSNLSASTASVASLPLPTQLSGVTVTLAGSPLPLRYVSPGQINALLPFGPPGYFQFAVSTLAGTSNPYQVALNTLAPSVYTLNESGTGAAFVFDANFNAVSQIGTGPLVLYASGLGPTNPPGNAAAGGNAAEPFNEVVNTVSVLMGGQPAQVLFAGLAPELPGVYQLNVIPPAVAPADNSLVVRLSPPLIAMLPLLPTVSSGATTLPVKAVPNTANVSGSASLLYPVNGTSLGFSELLTVANFNAVFDVLPGAQVFSVAATCAGGGDTIVFNPAAGTWQAVLTVPTVLARTFNFSAFLNANGSVLIVTNFAAGLPFAGNVVPQSLVDPIAANALVAVPGPNSPTGAPNATYTAQGAIPPGGHVVIDGSNLNNLSQFGGFVTAPSPNANAITRRAGCTLAIDGTLVSSVLASFN